MLSSALNESTFSMWRDQETDFARMGFKLGFRHIHARSHRVNVTGQTRNPLLVQGGHNKWETRVSTDPTTKNSKPSASNEGQSWPVARTLKKGTVGCSTRGDSGETGTLALSC